MLLRIPGLRPLSFKTKRLVLLTAVFCCAALASFSADIQSIGVPFVQNYAKSAYQSGNQNWSVSKGPGGVMYFGNSEGLLTFDGRYWQLYRMPNKQIVRAIATDDKGKVYVGGFGEFGFWDYNPGGKFTYTSLISKLKKENRPKGEIWKIYVTGKKVIFQSFAAIYIYENGKIGAPIRASAPFLFLFKAGDRFFVEVLSKGLYELKNNKLHFIFGSGSFGGRIHSILPFGNDRFLVGTAQNGLFVFDDQGLKPWENQAGQFLKKNQLNNGALVLGKYFAFGTILNGVVILDRTGNMVQHIDKSSGLQNNTVLSLFTDKDQNLWAGLDNGIDRIDINSPLYFYFDKTGKVGTVYSSIIHNNKIYLGTNQGLFYSEWAAGSSKLFQSFDFKLIEGSQGQVWDLSLIDNELLCGHTDGTFKVSGNSIHKISDIKGGWTIKKLKSDPNILIQGTYTGLALYKKQNNGQWGFSHKIRNFGEPSLYVEQDAKGNIWVSHAYQGLYKLKLSNDLKSVVSAVSFNSEHGLPGSYRIGVFNLEGNLVFTSDSGFYAYDDISNRFASYKELNSGLRSFATTKKIIAAREHKYWMIDEGKVALADFAQPGKISIDSGTFNTLNGKMVQYYENISRISSSIYMISVDDGFGIFNAANHGKYVVSLPDVIIRKIENTAGKAIVLSEKAKDITVPYNRNSIRISYSLPYYTQAAVKYQYRLEGYSKEWSEWAGQSQKEFSNLPSGEYTFHIRAKINNGLVSESSVFKVTVLPPWYGTVWAFILYGLLFIALLYFARRYYWYKLQKHKEHVQQKLQQEKEEHLQSEAIANEQQIVKLKNRQLEADLESKNRELANSAINIVTKNELLQKLRSEIYQIKDDAGNALPDSRLKRIEKVIEDGMNDERDWNLFENSFNEAHANFFKKIKSQHAHLVPNDLKLCAYLRMNMSSKEIASLLNITIRGVEIRRYRLRKKLDLPHNKNLPEFLMEL